MNNDNTNQNNKKKNLLKENKNAIIMLFTMFFVFCVLSMWQAVPLIFLFAIIMTLFKGKREYCSNYCPMGYVQDSFYDKKNENNKFKLTEKQLKIGRTVVFIVFWLYLIYYISKLYQSSDLLWTKIFVLIITTGSIAIITQKYIKKRFWCSNLCPFGIILSLIIKIRKKCCPQN